MDNASVEPTGLDKAANTFTSLLFPEEAQQPVDVPATEEAPSDAAPDTGEQAEAQAAEPEPQPKRSRKLRVGDEEIEVDEDEAYNGYLRQSDYTRKTQLVAEQRKQAEAELAATRTIREQYAGQLDKVAAAMDQWVPKEPDWAELAKTLKPEQYVQAQAEWMTFSKNRQLVEDERNRVARERLADLERDKQTLLAKEQERLLEAIPDWKDAAKAQTERQGLVAWLRGKGYTDEQIGGIADHRLIVALRNAKAFEDLQAQKPAAQKTVQSKIKPVTPGAPTTKRPSADRDRDLERLKKSGKMDDAARAFSHFVE